MKPNNPHSLKIWSLFQSKIGSGISKWNLKFWNPIDENNVSFTLEKPLFKGLVVVSQLKVHKGLFAVNFQGFDWSIPAQTVLDAEKLADFIDKIGNDSKAQTGHRAPAEKTVPFSAN